MNSLAIRTVNDLQYVAGQLVRSGMFKDCKNEAQAMAKIMYGAELGIGPAASVQCVIMIQGTPTLKASAWAGLVRKSGRYDYRVHQHDRDGCRIEFFQDGKTQGVAEFGPADAKAAGLDRSANYNKYASDMYFARAMTRGVRRFCPDLALGGAYTDDEIDPDHVEPEAITITEVEPAGLPEPTPPGGDGGGTEAAGGTDAAPSPANASFADNDFFKQTVLRLIEEKALPAGYHATLANERQVNTLLDLPFEERVELVQELEGMK